MWINKKIHDGDNYYVKGFHEFEEEESETWDLLAIVRDAPTALFGTVQDSVKIPHVVWEFHCDKECILEIYEGVTITGIPSTDDAFENENSNRSIERLPLPYRYSFYQSNFNIDNLGHQMYRAKFGNGISKEGHLRNNRAEFIGIPAYYLFRFIKESNKKGWLDFYFSYYLE